MGGAGQYHERKTFRITQYKHMLWGQGLSAKVKKNLIEC